MLTRNFVLPAKSLSLHKFAGKLIFFASKLRLNMKKRTDWCAPIRKLVRTNFEIDAHKMKIGLHRMTLKVLLSGKS